MNNSIDTYEVPLHTIYRTMTERISNKALIDRVSEKIPQESRFILGIAGIPGAGKTTLAARLAQELDGKVVAMDGFHYRNEVLRSMGLTAQKGIPETFDVESFIACLARVRNGLNRSVFCPDYSRVLHEPVEDAIEIPPSCRLVIVEGNYLLLRQGLWAQARTYLDECWYIATDVETALERVARRHRGKRLTDEEVSRKIEQTDRPNCALIESTKNYADFVFVLTD